MKLIIFIDVFSSNCLKTICLASYICYSIQNINLEEILSPFVEVKINIHFIYSYSETECGERLGNVSLQVTFDRLLCMYFLQEEV